MKIEIAGGYNVYRKNVSGEKAAKSTSSGESKKAAETDVSEITRGSTSLADAGLTTLKSKLQSEINLPASADRIEQIRQAIKDGSYRIPTETLVDSILSE